MFAEFVIEEIANSGNHQFLKFSNAGKDFRVLDEIKALFWRSRFLGFRSPIQDTKLHDSAQESVSDGANFNYGGSLWAFLPGNDQCGAFATDGVGVELLQLP